MLANTDKSPDDAGRLLHDIWRLAASLDAVSTRDRQETVQRVLDEGVEEYHELHSRAILMSDAGTISIDEMLDKIRARLKFLENLRR